MIFRRHLGTGDESFPVSAGHGKDVRGAIDQLRRKRLASKIPNVHILSLANFCSIETWRLSPNSVDAGGSNFDIFAVAKETAEKAPRRWGCGKYFRCKQRGRFSRSRLRARVEI